MTTYNTGNPLGSVDVRDLYDNAENLDNLVNGPAVEYDDRLGVPRKSLAGLRTDFYAFLAASGFETTVLTYTDGVPLQVDRPTQLLERASDPGTMYSIKLPSSFPVVLSGTWATDEALLVVRVDSALRQDLANPESGAEHVGHGGTTLAAYLDALGPSAMVSVEKFGIVPDGVTNWEAVGGANWNSMLAASLTTGVVWPPGYYATGLNFNADLSGSRMHFMPGAIIGGVLHLISDAAPRKVTITSISRASNVVTVGFAGPHLYSAGDRIAVRFVTSEGTGAVSFNGDDFTITAVTETTLQFSQVGPDVSGVLMAASMVHNRPVKDVVITGWLTTTDRLGTINCKDCYVENCWVMNDPSRHSAAPGTGCRGAHLYSGTDGLVMQNLIIDDGVGGNTDAALAVDGNAWNPSNLSIGRVHIKDSAYTAAYITGFGHRIGELRVDGFGYDVAPGRALQDSNGIAQSDELKGVWLNRCWDSEIDTVRVSQKVSSGTRGFCRYHLLVDETGHAYYNARDRGVRIGNLIASNVERRGISFGDKLYDSVTCNVSVGLIQTAMSAEGLEAGYYILNVIGGSARDQQYVAHARFLQPGINPCLYVETTGRLVGSILEAVDFRGRIFNIRGRSTIGTVEGHSDASSSITDPILQLQNAASQGTRIGPVRLTTTNTLTAQVLVASLSAGDWEVAGLTSSGIRHATATVLIDTPSARSSLRGVNLSSPDAVGVGLLFAGSVNDLYFESSRITGFASGVQKGSATFARCAAVAVNVSGNTVNTDLALASFSQLGCTNLTLGV